MSKVKLRWEQPPAGRRTGGRQRVNDEVAALQRRPGHWAKLRDAAAAGNYTTYRKRGVVTRVSSVGNNKYDIWGAWFGSPEEPAIVRAEQLEPNVRMLLPRTEDTIVTVQSVKITDEGKVLVTVLDNVRIRKLTAAKESSITVMGPA